MPVLYDFLCFDCRRDNCSCGNRNGWLAYKLQGALGKCTWCGKENFPVISCVCDLRKCPVGCGHALEQHETYSNVFTKKWNLPELDSHFCLTCLMKGQRCPGFKSETMKAEEKKKRFIAPTDKPSGKDLAAGENP